MKQLLLVATSILAAAVSCGKREAAPAPPPAAHPVDLSSNLLSIDHGAVIISRSGEFSLEHSAFDALDDSIETAWGSPPGDREQWMIVELPVKSTIRQVGIALPPNGVPATAPQLVRFELSIDGKNYNEVAKLQVRSVAGEQLAKTPPTAGRWLRITMSSSSPGQAIVAAPELIARGDEMEPWARPQIAGKWRFNQLEAELTQEGNHVRGKVSMSPEMEIDGGWDGRVLRFLWIRGKQHGVGCLTAEGDHLTGMWWFEKALPLFVGNPWFGERISTNAGAIVDSVPDRFLAAQQRSPIYDLAFDDAGKLDALSSHDAIERIRSTLDRQPGSRLGLASYEFRQANAGANLLRSRARLDSLLAALSAAGIDRSRFGLQANGPNDPESLSANALQRSVYSRIDLVLPH